MISSRRLSTLSPAALVLAWLIVAPAPAKSAPRKQLLALGDTHTGFTHDSIGHALATIDRLGRDSGLFDTYIRTDSQWITKQEVPPPARNARNLNYAAFYEWPEFGEMLGGYFDNHPWGVFDGNVVVEAPDFPAMKHFPITFRAREEFYQLRDKPYSRDKVRVLAHLDPTGIDLSNPNYHRKDQDFPVAMARTYGKGRTFWSTFGHAAETWDNPDIQKMYLEAIKWAMGLTKGDANPRSTSARSGQ